MHTLTCTERSNRRRLLQLTECLRYIPVEHLEVIP